MEKKRILLSIQEMDEPFSKMVSVLKEYAEVEVCDLDNYSLKDIDIFIGKKLKKEKLNDANKLKYIFAYKTGVDDFPLEELEKRNITLVNSHADASIIAEYAFGLSIALVNRINEFDYNLRKGIWYDKHDLYWKSFFDMKVGLFGYGHIGKEIHKLLIQNNIETYTIDRGHTYQNIKLVSSLEELVDTVDIIITSVPKTNDTNNVFNASIFDKMYKKYIVNVGRSNSINQNDLYNYLKENKIGGAAIDTWDEKPKDKNTLLMPSYLPFETLDNIILSPHAAMRVATGHQRYVEDITNNVLNHLLGKEIKNIVSLKKGY